MIRVHKEIQNPLMWSRNWGIFFILQTYKHQFSSSIFGTPNINIMEAVSVTPFNSHCYYSPNNHRTSISDSNCNPFQSSVTLRHSYKNSKPCRISSKKTITQSSSSCKFSCLSLAVPSESPTDEHVIRETTHNNNKNKRRIALFVEPSPFAYISGYKNRFQNFIRYLREMGDEVIVVTTHKGVPQEFYGAKVVGSWSFPLPWYQNLPLSLALSPRIIWEVAKFKPDIIHASSPGIMVFGALLIAKLLSVPLVMSYHTHVPIYIPKYTFSWLVKPMWLVIKFLHRAADLTLVTSKAVGKDLENARVVAANKIRLWQKGVDSESFHPRYKSEEMRVKLTDGEPHKPLIVHVGRLGVEKNLAFFKPLMDKLPGARLAFVGDGPYREELEEMFRGMPVVFTGMLHGEELSQAYASGDIFITPSESETLGFVVLEAMSSGVPIIAARAGGIPDIVPPEGEGKFGFLFRPGDVEDCLSKVQELLDSPELRSRIGHAGRTEVENHDWRAATRKVRDEEYNAAIWFWRKKRYQLLRRLRWWFGFPQRRYTVSL